MLIPRNTSRYVALAALVGSLCVLSDSQAGILVDLDPANAVYRGGPIQSNPNTPATASAGMTFNITFTPEEEDLSGTVLLMEIGGSFNGSGLYLVDGVPAFVSGWNSGGSGQAPQPFDDTVLNDADEYLAVDSEVGALSAGLETTVAVVLDNSSGILRLAVQNALGQDDDLFLVTGSASNQNWHGDRSLSVGLNIGNFTSRGGLNAVDADRFYREGVKDLAGTIGDTDALYWNDVGVIVPEPSTWALALVGTLAVGPWLLRRRNRGRAGRAAAPPEQGRAPPRGSPASGS